MAALLLLVVALAWATPALGQTSTLDLADYERLLREARAAAARGDRLEVELATAPLTAARAVRMPGGALAPVDNAWLAAELARPDPDLPLVTARLGALIDALALAGPEPPPDALARLEAILARPPFLDAPREPGPIERFLMWLAEQLGRLFEPMAQVGQGAPGTAASWLITALGGALVLAVLVVWLRGLRGALRGAAALASPAELAARDTADARARAEALARAGDYRGAVRFLALAALLWLDERGALAYDPHQTNREHLGRLREQPAARAGLAPIVEAADRVWYGGMPLDGAGYAEVARHVDDLRAAEDKPGGPSAQGRA